MAPGTDALPRAVYTVSEVCRILRPSMTPRKVHHWLHSGLLGEPVRQEFRGRPTLLSFDQLSKVRVVQRIRDDLGFSLPKVRASVAWILDALVEPQWGELHFFRTGAGDVGVADRRGTTFAMGGQVVLSQFLPELTAFLQEVRTEWETGVVNITDLPALVSDIHVMGGSPTVRGSRVETSFIAHLAAELDLAGLTEALPQASIEGIRQALDFEDVRLAA
jgi:uncharacterized protein (DUF433 family)